jgi:hypothetical protein
MRTISTAITIDAPPGEVWAALTDLPRYREWNPFIQEASGDLRVGGKLTLRLVPAAGRALTFRPRILALEEGKMLRWLGRLVLPYVFDGEHEFVLESIAGGGTLLTQSETFRGILVPFVGKTVSNTENDFRALNEALKKRVESQHSGQVRP